LSFIKHSCQYFSTPDPTFARKEAKSHGENPAPRSFLLHHMARWTITLMVATGSIQMPAHCDVPVVSSDRLVANGSDCTAIVH
jgi:hypothetical protein